MLSKLDTDYSRRPSPVVPIPREETRIARLSRLAACAGHDPAVFDARSLPEAQPALDLCACCPVPGLCDEVVRPGHSYFDGVAVGRIWVNGVPAGETRGRLEPTQRAVCGSEHGYERHRQASEVACDACRQAKADGRRRRRVRAKAERQTASAQPQVEQQPAA